MALVKSVLLVKRVEDVRIDGGIIEVRVMVTEPAPVLVDELDVIELRL